MFFRPQQPHKTITGHKYKYQCELNSLHVYSVHSRVGVDVLRKNEEKVERIEGAESNVNSLQVYMYACV